MLRRIEYIDIAKAIAIFIVVLSHTVSDNCLTKTYTMAFEISSFFMFSGMFYNPRKITTISGYYEWVKRKFKQIYIPYIIWGLIFSVFSLKSVLLVLYGSRSAIKAAGSLSSLWFLPVLFGSYCLMPAIFRPVKDWRWRILLCIIVAVLSGAVAYLLPHPFGRFDYPAAIDIAFMGAAFMLLGQLLKPIFGILTKRRWLVFVLMILSIAIYSITFQHNGSSRGFVLFAEAVYGKPWWFFFNSIVGSLMVFMLGITLSYLNINKRALLWIGQNTMGIYILHKPLVLTLGNTVEHYGYSKDTLYISLLIAFIGLVLSSMLTLVINKQIPQLFGKFKQ